MKLKNDNDKILYPRNAILAFIAYFIGSMALVSGLSAVVGGASYAIYTLLKGVFSLDAGFIPIFGGVISSVLAVVGTEFFIFENEFYTEDEESEEDQLSIIHEKRRLFALYAPSTIVAALLGNLFIFLTLFIYKVPFPGLDSLMNSIRLMIALSIFWSTLAMLGSKHTSYLPFSVMALMLKVVEMVLSPIHYIRERLGGKAKNEEPEYDTPVTQDFADLEADEDDVGKDPASLEELLRRKQR